LFGREGPYGGGRCGTMHMADFSVGYYGGNGIVGAALGLAMGAALAAQLERRDQVAVGFFGDGGANTGRTWEAINLAAVWRLPLVAVCENNLYAVETLISDVFAGDSIAQRAEGFGLPTVVVDGQDIGDVFRAVSAARDLAATGGGPTFIEARTYRYRGHSTGQVITYRTDDEVASWRNTRDPIARLARALEEAGIIASAACDEIVERAEAQVAAAIAFADAAPWPDVASAAANVTELNVSLQENP
jgi:TPP-dependent pyruvate/acetoin dehydrogenase alpha subunit